ncbi:MAG: DUF4097 family beta strand repeat-containing protein [Defluviitaleaceae bacterium]|nr:DUF4097 family beta strand repeat-containing protein [Defluviitaleaceae bacterium]
MYDKKIKILQRLEAGEISAEEALAMISQLSDTATPPTAGQHSNQPQFDSRQIDPRKNHSHETYDEYSHNGPDWINNIVGWVGEVVGEIADNFGDVEVTANLSDIFSGTYGHYKKTESFTSRPVLQGLAQLELHGKNDKIEVHAYEGDCVQLRIDYDARHPDGYVEFHEENGHISLRFDDKVMRSVRVICHVPRMHIGQVYAATKNGRIQVGDITAGDINLSTKNDKIILEAISCKSLSAVTKNGNIKAIAVTGENIILQTTNAKITAEDVHGALLNLKTTNAGIKTSGIDAAHLVLSTTNARLKLEDTLADTGMFWEGERVLEAYTTNSGVRLGIPEGIGFSIDAATTDSKATCDIPLYRSESSTKAHLIGESADYATAGRRLKIRLGTTNASVKIQAV